MNTLSYILGLLIVLPTPFLFFWLFYQTIENRTKKIIELLPDNMDAQFTDMRIWFKGYDMLKKVNRYQTDLFKSLYVYNLADLYTFPEGIVVIGKYKVLGKIWLLSPFVIPWHGSAPQLSAVPFSNQLISAESVDNDVEIKFHDQVYTNNITLVVKNAGELQKIISRYLAPSV